MTFHSKIVRGRSTRSARSLVVGAATVNVDQTMKLSRKAACRGSLESDWAAVGRDLKKAVRRVSRELETA